MLALIDQHRAKVDVANRIDVVFAEDWPDAELDRDAGDGLAAGPHVGLDDLWIIIVTNIPLIKGLYRNKNVAKNDKNPSQISTASKLVST